MNWFRNIQLHLLGVSATWTTCTTVAALVALVVVGGCASEPLAVDTNVVINFPSNDHVVSVEQADEMLDYARLARAQIDWRYRQKEQICYDKFFMNRCLREAKEERRVDLVRVKESEVAANFFKRKMQVEDMDRNLVEKNVASPLPDSNTVKKPVAAPNDDDSAAAIN